ncbi:MAG TPA: NAD-dependent epimerase/dehydratase family protein, partial [Pyrinomonadaceae bacterium]
MENIKSQFPYRRIVVTGGAGFLGRFIVNRLNTFPDVEIVVPRRSEINLVKGEDVRRLLSSARPDLVIHLAAIVGGIGANQKNPGTFFYENLMMGAQLMEESRLFGVQ